MKFLKEISMLLFLVIYLISSSGIVIFETNCSCTGNQEVSLFLSPETCGSSFHQHHEHDSNGNEISSQGHECHECSSHTNSCGCESPEVKYVKLINQLIDEEVKFIKVQSPQTDILVAEINWQLPINNEFSEKGKYYIDPPPRVENSHEFLIQIQQLKIPDLT